MTKAELIEYCLAKPNAELCYPLGTEYAVIKVKSFPQAEPRAFAEIFELEGRPKLTFRCDAATTRYLRVLYKKVVLAGYRCKSEHLPYKNTVDVAMFTDERMKYFVDLSYERACLACERCSSGGGNAESEK